MSRTRVFLNPRYHLLSRNPSSQLKRLQYSIEALCAVLAKLLTRDHVSHCLVLLRALKDQSESPFAHGLFVAMHPAFEYILVIGAPVDRDTTPTDDERNNEQVLPVFGRPVDRDAHFAAERHLPQGLMGNAFGQPLRRQPLIVQQS